MSVGNVSGSDAEFLHYYQYYKFQENSSDKIIAAYAKRNQLILNTLECHKYGDRAAFRHLLREGLDEYAKVVDNRNGVNNYAGYINALSSKSNKFTTECTKWKSNVPDHDRIKAMVENLNLDVKSADEQQVDESMTRNMVMKMKIFRDRIQQKKSVLNQSASIQQQHSSLLNKKEQRLSSNGNSTVFDRQSIYQPVKSILSVRAFKNDSADGNFSNSDNRSCDLTEPVKKDCIGFRTARTELKIQNSKKNGCNSTISTTRDSSVKRSLGARTRSVNSKFIPPVKADDSSDVVETSFEDERLKSLDPKMIELIRNEIMDHGSPVTWDDISGLEFAKKTIQEIVVWPLLRPDIFTGLRRPPKGILLFGPPGTGKTLIGKCIASQSSSTFFSISASSLTSKWIGESEKLVRTLFAVARCYQPAVIFIDEIDSLLSQRNETEHESSRRIKTEFLVQLDGATTHDDDRILVIGATNRPQELDEAARRRLVKRLYIPLPGFEARRQIVQRLMSTEKNDLSEENIDEIAKLANGYSGADMKNLCQEASLGPIRSIDFRMIGSIESQEVRPVTLSDFRAALNVVRSSVSTADLNQYLEWDKMFGSSGS